jgi:hypothetical protein
MTDDAVPRALIGGGLESKRPTVLQMWLIQWAPGTSLAGWALAAMVLQRSPEDDSGPAFILLGMVAGAALWAAVAVCSLPLFFLIRPLVDPLAREATRLRAAILPAAGAAPFLLVTILGWWLLASLNTHGEHTSKPDFVALLSLCVTFGVGGFAAVEMWTATFPAAHNRRSAFEGYRDITLAVRVKEDLEVLRLLLANSALAVLSMLTVVLPLALVGLVILAYQAPGDFGERRWVGLVALPVLALLAPLLIVLTSYQVGLWHFLSVRASGLLLFPAAAAILLLFSIGPLHELVGGISFGYSPPAWIYTGVLWLLSLPGFSVAASVLGMSLRLARVTPPLDPVVRGWRAWPTSLLAPALRTLCVPSFVAALPRGRFQSTLLFVLVVVLLALHTGLVLGPALSAPAILVSVVTSLLSGRPTTTPSDGLSATVGAAITARSSQASMPLPSLEQTLVAVPFVLILALLFGAVVLNRKLAARLLRRAHRRAAGIYQTITRHDPRASILFLRSFKEEQRLLAPPARSLLAKMLRLRDSRRTLDEIVLDAASPVGPVVALGIPAEQAAPLGAARFYANDAEWQEAIRGLVQQSRAVIICVEDGEGVLWELTYLLAEAHLTRTLCILTADTSSETLLRALQQARQSGNVPLSDLLEQVRAHGSQVGAGKLLAGVWFPGGVVTPIFAEDRSDYTHWCMVNLVLAGLTSGLGSFSPPSAARKVVEGHVC